jgi:hypothetical protein
MPAAIMVSVKMSPQEAALRLVVTITEPFRYLCSASEFVTTLGVSVVSLM